MNYFENRFEGILRKFSFSLRLYRHNRVRCEKCYQESLGQLDDIFECHDNHDEFSKQLMNCRDFYKKRLRKEYLGF